MCEVGEDDARLEYIVECSMWTRLRSLRPEEHESFVSAKSNCAEACCNPEIIKFADFNLRLHK